MKRIFLLAVLGLLFIPACSKEQSLSGGKQTRVSATKAYVRHFGPAPSTDKGTCYAFVIYFPSAKVPGKVLPFPFFTFDEASLKKVAVERLMAGMELPAFQSEVVQPFAPGAHLLKVSDDRGRVTVDLSNDFVRAGADQAGLVHALVLTLSQFEGVKGVTVLSEGKEVQFARAEQHPDPSWALEPAPPRLLAVTAMKEKGSKAVEEVDAYFDRPVDIAAVAIADKDGNPFAGTTYHSVFDMAAVLKPKDPSLFQEKMQVRVRWVVTDKVGRHAEGDDLHLLEVREH